MNRILHSSLALFLAAALPAPLPAATPQPALAPGVTTDARRLDVEITARQKRIKVLASDMASLDASMERRIVKAVDKLQGVTDSRDSGTRVARTKANVIDFLRKQITDYSRRRAQIRAEMDAARNRIPEATLASDIAWIDARINERIEQIVALGGSFAQHEEFDRFTVSGSNWWGGTEFVENPEWRQNRRVTQQGRQQQGKLRSAIDENISRLEFTNRSLAARRRQLSGPALQRVEADIARNNALIETLRGKRVTTLTNQSEGRTQLALSAGDARAVADQLTRTAADLRRDQTRLTTLFTELNSQRTQLAVAEVRRRAAPAPRP